MESDDDGREVNAKHLLNYESDSSNDNLGDDSDDFDEGLKKQKEEIIMNDAWGSKKKNFYGRDKKQDDVTSSEDDEDEYQEAMRLQKVRAKKLQQSKVLQQDNEIEVEGEKATGEISSEDSETDSDREAGTNKKLGDKLFGDDDKEESKKQSIKQLAKQVDKKMLKQMIEKESPELKSLLTEFEDSLVSISELQTLLDKKNSIEISKDIHSYLEMKYNLLMNYCTFLSFYLLMKVEGKSIKEHAVLFKINNIKNLLNSLSLFDERITPALQILIKKAASAQKVENKKKSKKREDVEDEEMSDQDEEDDINEEEISQDQEELEDGENDSEYGSEDEQMGEDASEEEEEIITKKDQEKLKKQQRKELRQKLNTLDEIDDLEQIISNTKKKAKKSKEEDGKKINRDAVVDQESGDATAQPQKQKITFNEIQKKQVVGDEVYEAEKQKLRDKKKERKEYEKEKKQNELEEVGQMNKNIQRNINYVIMKSKGLTRKRKKIDRNSRVKFRHKYEKALQKRKSRVQEFKEGPQSKYGGESTGLTARLIKSTPLS